MVLRVPTAPSVPATQVARSDAARPTADLRLPVELVDRVLALVPVSTLVTSMAVNHTWRQRALHDPLWRKAYAQTAAPDGAPLPKTPSWSISTWYDVARVMGRWAQGQAVRSQRVMPPDSQQYWRDAGSVVTRNKDHSLSAWDAAGARRCLNRDDADPRLGAYHKVVLGGVQHALRPDRLLTWAKDGSLCLWDLREDVPTPTLMLQHTAQVVGCAFHPENPNRVVSWAIDGMAILWDLDAPNRVVRLFDAHGMGLRYCYFPHDREDSVAAVGHVARLWNLKTGVIQDELDLHGPRRGNCHWFRHSALTIVGSGTASFWNRTTFAQPQQLHIDDMPVSVTGSVEHPVLPDTFITWGDDSHLLRVWDGRDGSYKMALNGHTQRIIGARIHAHHPDVLLTWSKDATVCVWDMRTSSFVQLRGHTDAVLGCATHPDNKELLITWSADQTIRIWRLPTGDDAAQAPTSNPLHVDGALWQGSARDCRISAAHPELLYVRTLAKLEIVEFSV